jgi:hypothetical protein
MKNASIIILLCLLIASCDDWLERDSKTIVSEEQVWNDSKQILALLANYYDRLPSLSGFSGDMNLGSYFDDASWSGTGNANNQLISYAYSFAQYWDYTFIRDINLAIENLNKYSVLPENEKKQFDAEFRFIRSFVYFELVKRMGGVPLITSQLVYDYSGDASNLQFPRAKESEIYDFIGNEIDAIENVIGNEGSVTRANKYTALSLKSRAMLYAASLAKYNNLMPEPIKTANGEVGIEASKANGYYQKSLEASKKIITSRAYSLYNKNADLGENFYEMLITKTGNAEIIFAKDYSATLGKRHYFTYNNIARGAREESMGSSFITPVLNLVESYEYLDGSPGTLKNKTSDGSDYIYYNNLSDIFKNKDARLYGTVVYPGTKFRGIDIDLQAGVKVWNGTGYETVEGSSIGINYTDGGLLVGTSGPHRSIEMVSNTGFNLRKMVSTAPMASGQVVLADNWWPWFRLGEIYLNAAEAAFELNLPEATNHINTLRERAGFPANSITNLTIDIIRNERRVELAFEDHRYFDLKRWRIAHELWDGNTSNPNAMLYALYAYRIVHPGSPNNGKYVFEKLVAPRFVNPRYFQMGNYYSSIATSVMTNNPKIIPNPFH